MAADAPTSGGAPGGGMFSQFPLIGVDRVLKRSIVGAVLLAVVGSAVAIIVGYPLVAPGLVLGLAMGLLNHRVFQSTALRFSGDDGTLRRRPFAGSVFLRLGACTAVALGLLVFVRPVGWGVVAGLALFQGLILVNAIVALLQYQRSDGSDVGA